MALTLVYECHATSTDNEAGRASGWRPGELSPRGREEAAELGRRRRDDGLAAVFCSDLRRAEQTAEIAFGGSGIPIVRDPRLRECCYGVLDGGSVEDVKAVRARHVEEPFPGGESYREVVARTAAFLADLSAGYAGRRVLVVAHSANRWSLEVLLKGADLAAEVVAPYEWQPGWEYVVADGWG